MPFDWMKAVEKNRDDLLEIVTRLFLMAGIRSFRSVAFLPRGLRLRILALLRPAEFAARRLIAMAACQLEVRLRPSTGRKAPSQNSVIPGLDSGTGEAPSSLAGTRSMKPGKAADDREGNDVLHHRGFREVSGTGPRVRPEDDAQGETPRQTLDDAHGAAPPAFALFDPFKPFGHPWLEEGDGDAGAPFRPGPDLDPGEPVGARSVCRRIVALEAALQDIGGQARRLARWRARRHLETARPRRWSPMRPGRPPGWRRRPRTPVEEVLRECHGLALRAWNNPDTS